MDSAIILKINEIERKLEKIQEELEKAQSDSSDTENLIAAEIHLCIKLFRIFFVMHNVTCHNNTGILLTTQNLIQILMTVIMRQKKML